MDVNFDPGMRPPATVPTPSVVEVAALAAQQVAAPVQAGLGRQQSFGRDEPGADPHAPQPADLGEAVARLQDHVQTLHRELHFRVDEATGQTVVRVVDADTGKLVRQMPSQEALDTLQTIETLQASSGLLLRERA
ncbi:MAG: flagellar protein FlaG [Gammaproteobacteria bacterium]